MPERQVINLYKVRLKTRWSGPGINHKPGDVLDLDDSLGKGLIESGSADLIEVISEKVIESAVIQPIEKAVMPKPVARKPVRR